VPSDARDRILEAATEVMARRGLAGATTKEIARAAGCSEALLYKHFPDKEEIFFAVIRRFPSGFITYVAELPDHAGERTVAEQLTELVERAVPFYTAGMSVLSSLLTREDLAVKHRAWLAERDAGPHKANEALADYLRAEQERGRVAPDVDADGAAALLLGACYQRAFLDRIVGADVQPLPADGFAAAVVGAALRGL
jgi:AcrR family transcriptional regulator